RMAMVVTTAHQAVVNSTLKACAQTCAPIVPSMPVPPSDSVLNTPVSTAPTMPPTACTPNTSAVSSTRSMRLRPFTPQTQVAPTARPITIAPIGPTVPAAGVMPTRPATAPEAAPSADGRPLAIASTRLHATTPAAVATMVLIIASAASAATAEPALKPNQPTHSSEEPMKVNGK